jgi:hypothetical protein
MSTVTGGQGNIVTNGLVLNLDAANPRSYPQPFNGVTWFDISGNAFTGSLVNGPTYNSSNGGSIVLDGSNDIVNLPVIAFVTNPFTIDVWFWMNGLQSQNDSIIAVAAAGAANNWQLSFDGSNIIRFFYKGANAADAFPLNYTFISQTWTNIMITKDSNNDIRSYVNGRQTNLVNYVANYNHTQILRLGLNRGGIAYYNGRIAICRLYNGKGLNEQEVLQNFNATRARFGV